MREKIEFWVLVVIIPLCSMAGVAAAFRASDREGTKLTPIQIVSAALNSGLCSAAIAAIMFWYFGIEYLWLIVGVSVLAGLGGNVFIDFVVGLFQRNVEKWLDGKISKGK